MGNRILNFLSQDISELPSTSLVLIFGGAFLFVAVTVFLIYVCKKIAKLSGKNTHSILKIIMIALFPTIFNIAAVTGHILPIGVITAITVVLSIIVIVWNILQFGPIGGAMFSFLHIVGGLATGLMLASFVLVAIFGIATVFIARPGDVIAGNGGASNSIPEYVEDINTREIFYVSKNGDGRLMIDRNGNWVPLFYGDSAGRFTDTSGNTYIAHPFN